MGSIIAAMYAAGYSPAQMREIVASGVVKEWVSGRIDPRYTQRGDRFGRQLQDPAPVYLCDQTGHGPERGGPGVLRLRHQRRRERDHRGRGRRAGRGISAVFRKRSRKLPGDACRPRGSCRVRRFL